MKGILRGICRAVPFLLLAAVVLAVSLFPRQSAAEGESVRIVRVWNVDTFEGGKGSRTAFLKRAAELAERGRTGVRYLVTSVTAEGALDALGRGELPDVLSYGGGLSAFEPHCLPLGERFAGESRALPWCRGEYYLFSLTDDFESAGEVAISVGGSNLACSAAYFAGVSGSETESLSAYVDFLGGKYRYLLGTQRDKCRFASRGAAVYAKPLTEFCDLYQYVSVLSEEAYDRAGCARGRTEKKYREFFENRLKYAVKYDKIVEVKFCILQAAFGANFPALHSRKISPLRAIRRSAAAGARKRRQCPPVWKKRRSF